MPVVDKATGVLSAILFALWGVVFAWAAWVVSGMACDEGCRDPAERGFGDNWRSFADSWQWTAIYWLGLAALAAALLVIVVAAIGSRRFATGGLVLHSLLAVAAAALYDVASLLEANPEILLAFVVGLALGVGTIAGLTKPPSALGRPAA